MSSEESRLSSLEKLAEEFYGDDVTGEEMRVIQRWHFLHKVGMSEDEYTEVLDNGQDLFEDLGNEDLDSDKVIAGFGIYVLHKTKEKVDHRDYQQDYGFY